MDAEKFSDFMYAKQEPDARPTKENYWIKYVIHTITCPDLWSNYIRQYLHAGLEVNTAFNPMKNQLLIHIRAPARTPGIVGTHWDLALTADDLATKDGMDRFDALILKLQPSIELALKL